MAITSKFYTGSVDHVEWSKAAGEVGSTFYGAETLGSWQPTAVSGVDRTVRIAPGVVWGRGVRDTNDTNIDVSIPLVSSGTRWDLIVARRTWGTSTTTVVRVAGTSTKGIPAGRTVGPGVVDDQPLALVKVTAGSTAITELVDLRCFGGAGGLQALDKLALQYLNFPGALVQVGTEFWTYPADGSAWVKAGNYQGLDLFGYGAALQGSGSTSTPFQFQGGSVVQNTDANGYARLTFPKSFPNGLLTVVAINGDDFAVPRAFPSGAGGPAFGMGGRNWWTYRLLAADGDAYKNRTHRVNWLAIGF